MSTTTQNAAEKALDAEIATITHLLTSLQAGIASRADEAATWSRVGSMTALRASLQELAAQHA